MSTLLEQLLDLARRAECARHELHAGTSPNTLPHVDLMRAARGEPHTWQQVPFRTAEAPQRRRADPPHPSRFGADDV